MVFWLEKGFYLRGFEFRLIFFAHVCTNLYRCELRHSCFEWLFFLLFHFFYAFLLNLVGTNFSYLLHFLFDSLWDELVLRFSFVWTPVIDNCTLSLLFITTKGKILLKIGRWACGCLVCVTFYSGKLLQIVIYQCIGELIESSQTSLLVWLSCKHFLKLVSILLVFRFFSQDVLAVLTWPSMNLWSLFACHWIVVHSFSKVVLCFL